MKTMVLQAKQKSLVSLVKTTKNLILVSFWQNSERLVSVKYKTLTIVSELTK